MKRYLFYFILLFVIPSEGLSIDSDVAFNTCNRYFKNNDYKNAIEWCGKAAKAGHSEAQYRQGMFYYEGKGVPKSFRMAIMWIEKSAEQEFPQAQYKLSEIYRLGKGVSSDMKKSIFWLTKAAENDFYSAIKELADIYYNGSLVEKNFKKSADWYMKLAEKGDPDAQYRLGYMYDNAEWFQDDDVTAFSWFMKAAKQGHAKSQTQIAWMYERAEGVEQNYGEAFKWYIESAKNGYADGQLHLARMYSEGKGVKQDYQKAFHWAMKSAVQGNSSAQNEVGLMYLDGLGVEIDVYKAYEWVQKASLSKNDVFIENEKKIRSYVQSVEVDKANELLKSGKYRDAYELAKNSKFKGDKLKRIESIAKQHLSEEITPDNLVGKKVPYDKYDVIGHPETLKGTNNDVWVAYFPKGNFTIISDKKTDIVRNVYAGKKPQPSGEIRLSSTRSWYEGGTLHSAKGKDWRTATNANRLATSADFVAKASTEDLLTFTIQGIDDLKPYAVELSNCLTEFLKSEFTDTQPIPDSVFMCMGAMKWLK
jgi:hypothetical protein